MNSTITNRSRTSTLAIVGSGTALAANKDRVHARIQNTGTNPLFVCLGPGASIVNYSFILRGNTVAEDGTSPPYDIWGYTGVITVDGTTAACVASEDIK